METQHQDLAYHNGRLLLPLDLVDRPSVAVASWLGKVPVTDRARAFRALPLNVGAAAFLVMQSPERLGLLAGLDRQTIRYLVSLSRDEYVVETLLCAEASVHSACLSALPAWRHERISQMLGEKKAEASAMPLPPVPARQGVTRFFGWLRQAV